MIKKEDLKKAVMPPPDPVGPGNLFEVFSCLEDIAGLLSEFLPKIEKIIALMENTRQIPTAKPTTQDSNLQEKLTDLLAIAKETRETSSFVKMIFTQQKPKKARKKVDKSEAVNEYLRKYNKSMKF